MRFWHSVVVDESSLESPVNNVDGDEEEQDVEDEKDAGGGGGGGGGSGVPRAGFSWNSILFTCGDGMARGKKIAVW